MVGKDLLGKVYEPLFPYFSDMSATAFRVCNDTYVTDDSGTGIVHQVHTCAYQARELCRKLMRASTPAGGSMSFVVFGLCDRFKPWDIPC